MFSLHHLRYFIKAAEFQNIAKAARSLNITPSALSQAIVGLERDLDTPLLHHQRKKFELTESGRLLLERGQILMQDVVGLKNDLLREHGREEGEITFMTQQSIASTLLPATLGTFIEKWPRIRPNVLIGTREEVHQGLASGSFTFGISVNRGLLDQGFNSETLYQGHYVLTGVENPAPWYKRIILSDSMTPEIKKLARLLRETYSYELSPAFMIKSWSVGVEMSAVGLGVGFVPDYVIARLHQNSFSKKNAAYKSKMITWPFKEKIPYQISAIWRKGQTLCSCSRKFLDHFMVHQTKISNK